ncbi:hypothetical protein MASR1M32_37630 [Rhodobacter sp.]
MQPSTSSKAIAGAAVWLAGSGLACSAISEAAPVNAIEGAIYACAGQPLSIEGRLQALNAAQWLVAEDTPNARDYFGHLLASQYGFPTFLLDQVRAKALVAREDVAPPASAVFWRSESRLKGEALAEGKAINVEAVIASAKEHDASVELYLTLGDVHAVLQVLALRRGNSFQDFHLFCNLFLAQPLDEDFIVRSLPEAVKPADVRKERTYKPTYSGTLLSYSTTSGYAGEVTYVDATTLAPLKAYQSRFGSKAKISTILNFDSLNVPLQN